MHAGRAQAAPRARGPTLAHHCVRTQGRPPEALPAEATPMHFRKHCGLGTLDTSSQTPGFSRPSSLATEQTLPSLLHCISSEGDGGHSRPHLVR